MKDLLVLLADGFEEIEALTPVDFARRAELVCDLVSIEGKSVRGSHDIYIDADVLLDEINPDEYKALYIPGGLPGATNLKNDKRVLELVKKFYDEKKLVAAICAGPEVLNEAGILEDGQFTCYPGVEDRMGLKDRVDEPFFLKKNVLTSMGPSTALIIGLKLVELLKGVEAEKKLEGEILFDRVKKFIREDVI